MNQFETNNQCCPICNGPTSITSKDNTPTSNKLFNKGAKLASGFAINKGVQVVTSITPLAPIAPLLGLAAKMYTKKYVNAAYDKKFKRPLQYIRSCPYCCLSWDDRYSNSHIYNYISEQKNIMGKSNSDWGKCILKFVLLIIAVGFTWFCWNYCHIHDATSYHTEPGLIWGTNEVADIHPLWYVIGILFLIFIPLSIMALCSFAESLSNNINEFKRARKIRKMSIQEFVLEPEIGAILSESMTAT